MKLVSKALLLAGLAALGACGGGEEENTAANAAAVDDLYNTAPDDLTLDNALDGELGNDLLGNDVADEAGNSADAGNAVDGNSVDNIQ